MNDSMNEYLESLSSEPEGVAPDSSGTLHSKKVYISDQDAEMIDASDIAALNQSSAFARSLAPSKYREKDSRLLEIANLKLKYED